MKIETIEFDRDRKIHVIDNAVNFSEVSGIYASTVSCQYSIYNSSEAEIQDLSDKRLGCPLMDLTHPILLSLYSKDRIEILSKYIPQDKYYHWRSYINLGLVSDIHKIHVDEFSNGDGLTLLYYVNRNWNCDWGGETIFYDDERKNIKYVSSFVPGRIIIFESSIPHSAKPQHLNGPSYRFTLACKFKRISHEN